MSGVKILEVLQSHEEGLTVSEIAQLADVSWHAAKSRLDKLVLLRKVRCVQKGKNLKLYYPIGELLRKWRRVVGETTYEFSLYLNKDKLYLHISEWQKDVFGERPAGAILVPVDHIDKFVDALQSSAENASQILRQNWRK